MTPSPLQGRVTYVGNTSMEVCVDTYVEHLECPHDRSRVNRAYLTMVAIGADGRPARVPALVPETSAERADFEAGKGAPCPAPARKKGLTDKSARAGCVSGAAPVFFGSVLGLFPENEADGRSLETEALAQVILQIALVGEVHQLLAVDEKHKRRRARALLRGIVDLEAGGRRRPVAGGWPARRPEPR